ncbi:unnamed protein product [Symbiodinium natans]|uniref:Uncharacterized protein n=1 Tax=Symbiodinium natans TaxID=878477 RepID=A0A812V3E5_9DINO|nr:unnamed protein product [Symbiodinium natans]
MGPPEVKYGMGIILCLLGCQMILARVILLQPLLTCGMMLAIIVFFVVMSAVMRPKAEDGDKGSSPSGSEKALDTNDPNRSITF